MTTEAAKVPDTKEIVKETSGAMTWANQLVVETDEQERAGWDVIKSWKGGIRKKINDAFDHLIVNAKKLVASAKAHVKEVEGEKAVHTGPLDQAENIARPKLLEYRQRKDQEAAEARTKAEAAARAEAEKQRKKELALLAKQGTKKQLREAKAAPLPIAPVVVREEPQKISGVSFQTNWSAEVTDFKKLVKAVADGKVPLLALKPDQVWLNGRARADKDKFIMPGVRAVGKKTPHVSAETGGADGWG